MEPAVIASILVSLIAAVAGYASQRAAAKASTKNASTSSRADLEKEAYERARAFDMATIQRQDSELTDLREQTRHQNNDLKILAKDNESLHDENRHVLEDNEALRAEVRALRLRLTKMERGMHPDDPTPIQERELDTNPMMMRELFNGGE